jgi:hypothetical protein
MFRSASSSIHPPVSVFLSARISPSRAPAARSLPSSTPPPLPCRPEDLDPVHHHRVGIDHAVEQAVRHAPLLPRAIEGDGLVVEADDAAAALLVVAADEARRGRRWRPRCGRGPGAASRGCRRRRGCRAGLKASTCLFDHGARRHQPGRRPAAAPAAHSVARRGSPAQTRFVRFVRIASGSSWRWIESPMTALSRTLAGMMATPVPAATQATIAW